MKNKTPKKKCKIAYKRLLLIPHIILRYIYIYFLIYSCYNYFKSESKRVKCPSLFLGVTLY